MIYAHIYFTTVNAGKIDVFLRKAAYFKLSEAS